MADVLSLAAPQGSVEPDLRRGIELLYFGYRDFTSGPDTVLRRFGLGRAHHRALYFIARRPGLIISDLLNLLRITKQSLARVVQDLQAHGMLDVQIGAADKRQRHVTLTPAGAALERELYEAIRTRLQAAYVEAGPQAAEGFCQVLQGLLEPEVRLRMEGLRNS
jgi:DNA-binding MarR family transcriptional regulator